MPKHWMQAPRPFNCWTPKKRRRKKEKNSIFVCFYIGAIIRKNQEIQYIPYAGFLNNFSNLIHTLLPRGQFSKIDFPLELLHLFMSGVNGLQKRNHKLFWSVCGSAPRGPLKTRGCSEFHSWTVLRNWTHGSSLMDLPLWLSHAWSLKCGGVSNQTKQFWLFFWRSAIIPTHLSSQCLPYVGFYSLFYLGGVVNNDAKGVLNWYWCFCLRSRKMVFPLWGIFSGSSCSESITISCRPCARMLCASLI